MNGIPQLGNLFRHFVALSLFAAMHLHAQDATGVINQAIATLNSQDVKSLVIVGHGFDALFGQAYDGDSVWPRFALTRYSLAINYQDNFLRHPLTESLTWRSMNALETQKNENRNPALAAACSILFALSAHSQSIDGHADKRPPLTPKLILPAGVEKLCSISFDKDQRRPARVEDGALPCLTEVAKILTQRPDLKLVLVGVSDPVKDHEEKDAGEEREGEDMTGLDIRYEDTSAYRAVNTKDYLTRFYAIAPSRIIPTTNENRHGQDVAFYLVPGDADFLHNYLNTTRTNENPCTVKPCYDPREEKDSPQPRARIRTNPQPSSNN
jgi:hypothetical protein